jgi:hypothetical protein
MPLGRSPGWTETLETLAAFAVAGEPQAARINKATRAATDLVIHVSLYEIDLDPLPYLNRV